MKASTIFTELLIVVLMFLFVKILDGGLLRFILAIGLGQLCYHNWKWPKEFYKDVNLNLKEVLTTKTNSFFKKKNA